MYTIMYSLYTHMHKDLHRPFSYWFLLNCVICNSNTSYIRGECIHLKNEGVKKKDQKTIGKYNTDVVKHYLYLNILR